MKRLVAVAAIVLAGCSPASSHPVAHVTAPASVQPSAEPTVEPSPSPTAEASPSPSFTPIADLPITTVDFSCRLPIVWADAMNNDMFLTLPSGDVSLDPNSHGIYYDRAFSRWLPVGWWSVSRDGLHYASIESGQNGFVLHVVEVATGKDVSFNLASTLFNGQPFVFDYSADGIYLWQGFEHLLPGLWLVDPVTGSVRQISKDLYPAYSAGNGIVWTQQVNPADPSPVESGTSVGTLPDEIDKVDLRTGTRTEWLYIPGRWVEMIGLDSKGIPLIASKLWNDDSDAEVVLVASPNSEKSIYKGPAAEWMGGGASDAHGMWIGSQRGIYLYTTSGVMVKVSNHPAGLANTCL